MLAASQREMAISSDSLVVRIPYHTSMAGGWDGTGGGGGGGVADEKEADDSANNWSLWDMGITRLHP